MPYAFAHPAAVIPIHRLLGRHGVPSALVVGSVIPDAWYFLPFATRADTHSLWGLLLFCLPAGLLAYAAFHLIFKQPLLALLPRRLAGRLRSFACPELPAVSWGAVIGSIALGTATHLAWDGLTHRGLPALEYVMVVLDNYELRAHQVLQHGSTLLGTACVCAWTWRKLRTAPVADTGSPLSVRGRAVIAAALLAVGALAFLGVAAQVPASNLQGLRSGLRAAGVTAASFLGLATLCYCLLWRLRRAQ